MCRIAASKTTAESRAMPPAMPLPSSGNAGNSRMSKSRPRVATIYGNMRTQPDALSTGCRNHENYRIFRESHKELHQDMWQLIERRDPGLCWRWNGSHSTHGYAKYTFRHDGHVCTIYPHRYLYYAFYDKLPDVVHHTCGNKWCCNINHLATSPSPVVLC